MLRVLEGQSAFDPARAGPRAMLREEARRCVGDTGLLDHLLRHMPRAGELAQVRKTCSLEISYVPCSSDNSTAAWSSKHNPALNASGRGLWQGMVVQGNSRDHLHNSFPR